jgi:hypothetical protein
VLKTASLGRLLYFIPASQRRRAISQHLNTENTRPSWSPICRRGANLGPVRQRANTRLRRLPFGEQFVPDLARRRRKSDATRLPPNRLVDLVFVADRQVSRCSFGDEDCIAHFSTGTTVPGLDFLPKPDPPKLELSNLLFDLSAQTIFSLSRARFRLRGNIHNRSRLRLTKSTRPRFSATSFEDFAIFEL